MKIKMTATVSVHLYVWKEGLAVFFVFGKKHKYKDYTLLRKEK